MRKPFQSHISEPDRAAEQWEPQRGRAWEICLLVKDLVEEKHAKTKPETFTKYVYWILWIMISLL